MAVPARSVAAKQAPAVAESAWPWHTPVVASVRASLLHKAQRRMEAESYLADGYGVRLAIEAKPSGWARFSTLAHASTPPRIKQILVSPEHGVPYLNTSQIFAPRPTPRKWLAMAKTTKGAERLVSEGTILVMASATVGRAIVATKSHEGAIVSHHFMRVVPVQRKLAGWVYGFLRSPQAQAMMTGTQYASVIRHIEPKHLATLPVPNVSDDVARYFLKRTRQITRCRNNAASLRGEAETLFSKALKVSEPTEPEHGFTVDVRHVVKGRRRLEAAYHTPQAQKIVESFKHSDRIGDVTEHVWWGKRFKRHYGDGGIPYMSADDVFTMNPCALSRILVEPDDGHEDFFVERGWLLMACSGQTYGLNGATTIATKWHENTFFSHDLIRIIPVPSKARPGYLLTALTHPTLGRPLLMREAYGMSIPHLDPKDVAAFPLVRLGKKTEDAIADLAEKAASEQARAEVLERELSEAAGKVVSEFLMSDPLALVPSREDKIDAGIAAQRLAEIKANPERVLRGKALQEKLKQWEA